MNSAPATPPIGFRETLVAPSEESVGRSRAPIVVVGAKTPSNTRRNGAVFSPVENAIAKAKLQPTDDRKSFMALHLALDKGQGADAEENHRALLRLVTWRWANGSDEATLVVPDFKTLGQDLTDAICRAAVGVFGTVKPTQIRTFSGGSSFPKHTPSPTFHKEGTGFMDEDVVQEYLLLSDQKAARSFENASAKARELNEIGWGPTDIRRYLSLYGFTNRSGNAGMWEPARLTEALEYGTRS